MSEPETVDLNFLARLSERILVEQREMRADMADMRRAILQLIDKSIRHERRFDELEHRIVEAKADIELMMRQEVMGRLANFETRMEARFREGFSEGEQPLLTP
jgi:hypothetical protein